MSQWNVMIIATVCLLQMPIYVCGHIFNKWQKYSPADEVNGDDLHQDECI